MIQSTWSGGEVVTQVVVDLRICQLALRKLITYLGMDNREVFFLSNLTYGGQSTKY